MSKKKEFFEKLKVNKLPALPHVLNKILEACQSDIAGMDRLANIIRHDAVLTSKIIATANSATYFQKQQVNRIDKALLLIGTELTKTIAVTAAVQQFLAAFDARQTEYLKSFWTASLRCALLAKTLASLTHYAQPEQAYLTGLLHKIGELALRTNFPSEYKWIDNPQSGQEESLSSRETKILRTNHCEFGAWLLERWGLGEFPAAAVKYHHEPLQRVLDAHPLVKIIHAASHLGEADEKMPQTGFEAMRQLFGLNHDLTEDISAKAQQEVITIASSLQIEITGTADDSERVRQQDENEHLALAGHVRDIGLMHSAREHMETTRTLSEIGRAIEACSFMVFGFTAARLFLLDEETRVLRYVDLYHPTRTAADSDSPPLEVPLEQTRSIMAAAVVNNEVINSAQWEARHGDLPVIDQHVLSLLNAPHMICVPFRGTRKQPSPHKYEGLLAFATHQPLKSSIQSSGTLRVFAANAGRTYKRISQEFIASNNGLSPDEQYLRLREISHEISNPLAIISNYLDILSGRLAKENQAQKEISIIRDEIIRVGDILINISDERTTDDNTKGTDINREIHDLISLFSASYFLSRNIQCNTETDTNLKPQAVPRSYIRQILINLIKNAAEAMPEGGELTIITNHQVNINGKRYTEMTVSDNGPGIDIHLLPDLLESGGTTKGDNHQGLGLSISKSLVEELNGMITCRNLKQGAEFQIFFPTSDVAINE